MKQPHSRSTRVANIIRGAMARSGIKSQKELSEFTGIREPALSKRLNGEVWWDLVELWRLDMTLHFTDEEWLRIKGGYK
jgi:hypothetical protein